ncbi:DUF3019 domain-containing protein [Inhella proteolytica]|uniref:DUF3019 domain-containing protein n=1 Tax=Inhella proteolytica TaxID=2795029 RepID=A0A931JBT3_9BURK|nr:DUF3019 domain-containing protein [Inhella proteolytica]MBH9579705.1 DUF3019 domain-containing protein [Inhella proteolytica]
MSSKPLLATLVLLAVMVFARAEAPLATLELAPVQCVALHRGQSCHFDARLRWQARQPARYCLHRGGAAEAPLHCWPLGSEGQLELPMQASSDVLLELRRSPDGLLVAQGRVEIAWVYRSERRARGSWRLF